MCTKVKHGIVIYLLLQSFAQTFGYTPIAHSLIPRSHTVLAFLEPGIKSNIVPSYPLPLHYTFVCYLATFYLVLQSGLSITTSRTHGGEIANGVKSSYTFRH